MVKDESARARLDPTRHSPTTTTSMTTGQAGYDDVEERGDSTNDGLENAGNAIDDCHEAAADGLADVFDTRDDGSHFDGCCDLRLVCI